MHIPRLRNDLLCVEWDVKPYTITHSLMHIFTVQDVIRLLFIIYSFIEKLSNATEGKYKYKIKEITHCLVRIGGVN